jgi:hypothetical protein
MRMKIWPVVMISLVLTAWAATPTRAAAQPVELNWLAGSPPSIISGASWGVPFSKGAVPKNQAFRLTAADGRAMRLQTWPLAYWPDGSLKWIGLATVAQARDAGPLKLEPVAAASVPAGVPVVRVRETTDAIEVDTGAVKCRLPKNGPVFLESLEVEGRVVARGGRLVAILQNGPDTDALSAPGRDKFVTQVDEVRIEQSGPIRAVVRVKGVHRKDGGDRRILPFDVRLYFHAGVSQVRLVHTIIHDLDEQKDFVRGLGLAFDVPLREQSHNRHVRFGGEGSGLWSESIQPATGRASLLQERRDLYPDQVEGKRLPDRDALSPAGRTLLDNWAIWDDFKLTQSSADGFRVEKRTNAQSAWIAAGAGGRASGLAFVGDVSGGLAVGVKNFWQSHPGSLDVHGAATATAELRVWLWSPDAPAMDMRHYDTRAHDLNASYEDVQPGFSTPFGIARTSELTLYPYAGVPTKDETARAALTSREPPLLVATPAYLHSVGAFGVWSLPDRKTAGKAWVEDQLDSALAFYLKEIEQRRWYGFWDYGDVMHAYDNVRHTWRYDIGGFAWDNSELVPDMWLWYSFLRSGRADVFKMAEAMTRHTGEVDVSHAGRFKGLGSRHNVRHWGDGAKEARISQAALRRFHHYLTTDERSGDLMREEVDADLTLAELDPMRLAMPVSRWPTKQPARARVGPDWLALVGNWMTEWERTGDTKYRDWIVAGMDSVASMPYGLFSGPGVLGYDPKTKRLYNEAAPDSKHTSHLVTIMGGAEVIFELAGFLDHPGWKKAWLMYCRQYSEARDGVGGGSNPQWHARLTAYAAMVEHDPALADRAWRELLGTSPRGVRRVMYPQTKVEVPNALRPIDEVSLISTNSVAQWSLNAIQVLALAGDRIPERSPLWDDK